MRTRSGAFSLIGLVVAPSLFVGGCSKNAFWPQGPGGASLSLDGSVPGGARKVSIWASPTEGMEEEGIFPFDSLHRFLWKPFSVDEISCTWDENGAANCLLRWVSPSTEEALATEWVFFTEGQLGSNQDGYGRTIAAGMWSWKGVYYGSSKYRLPFEVIYEKIEREGLKTDRLFAGLAMPPVAFSEHVSPEHSRLGIWRGWGTSSDWGLYYSLALSFGGWGPFYIRIEGDSFDGRKVEFMFCFEHGFERAARVSIGYANMRWGKGWTFGIDWRF